MKTVTVTVCSFQPMLHIVTTWNQLRFYIIFLQGSHLDTSAPTFARSAQERMLSFSERKGRLIENARRRYIEKHGLKSAGFSSWWPVCAAGMMGLCCWHFCPCPFLLCARSGPHRFIICMVFCVTCSQSWLFCEDQDLVMDVKWVSYS